MERLYTSSRTSYNGPKKTDECPFCSKYTMTDEQQYEHLIIAKTKHSIIMLNLYPYNPGHLLVIPKSHTADITTLSIEAQNDLFQALMVAITAAKIVNNTEHLNIGMNIGSLSGGSIQSHAHIHIVPRFMGDTNFLTVISEVKVITKDLKTMYDLYKEYFTKHPIALD